jgi:hypothetical protein
MRVCQRTSLLAPLAILLRNRPRLYTPNGERHQESQPRRCGWTKSRGRTRGSGPCVVSREARIYCTVRVTVVVWVADPLVAVTVMV